MVSLLTGWSVSLQCIQFSEDIGALDCWIIYLEFWTACGVCSVG